MTNKRLFVAAFAGWVLLLVGGWAWMARYGSTPGEQALAPPLLPAALKQMSADSPHKQALFVALHPQCSCSRATLHELHRVLQQAGSNAPAVYVLMYRPSRPITDWSDDGVLPVSSLVANAKVVPDPDGSYAAMLHAGTSGEVILYARDGRLLFQGGVTASRGHEGSSAGAERLQAALESGKPSSALSSVFGCNLFHRETAKGKS